MFQLGESFFCIYFTFEVIIRFLSFKDKRNCIKDGWFNFDTVLVTLMVAEAWCLPLVMESGKLPFPSSLLRLLRLLRLARMVRLLRGLPELLTLVNAMGAAIRSVSTVMVLLILLLYVFGLIFKMFLGGALPSMFGSIPLSMQTLFMAGTLGDNISGVFEEVVNAVPFMAVVFSIYFFLTMFTVLNMLIGVLCEVVTAVSEASKEEVAIDRTREKFQEVLQEIDEDGNGLVSRDEFKALIDHPEAKQAFIDLDVDIENFETMSSHMFDPITPGGDEEEMPFEDFLKRVLDMRSGNVAKYNDVIEVNKMILRGHQDIESKIDFKVGLVEQDIASIQQMLLTNGSPSGARPMSPGGAPRANPLRDLEDRLGALESKVESQFDLVNAKLDRLLNGTP